MPLRCSAAMVPRRSPRRERRSHPPKRVALAGAAPRPVAATGQGKARRWRRRPSGPRPHASSGGSREGSRALAARAIVSRMGSRRNCDRTANVFGLSRLLRYRGRRTTRRDIMKRFQGTETYVATDDLRVAVNAAIALERPLLVKGEPGTGKTILAHEIARGIARDLITWHIKSTTKAQQGLYEYDAVSRLRDGQLGDERVHDIANYIVPGKLWEAFEMAQAPVLLIDEIDKADIEFPNDLLLELDRMEFYVYETRRTIQARHRPIVII